MVADAIRPSPAHLLPGRLAATVRGVWSFVTGNFPPKFQRIREFLLDLGTKVRVGIPLILCFTVAPVYWLVDAYLSVRAGRRNAPRAATTSAQVLRRARSAGRKTL